MRGSNCTRLPHVMVIGQTVARTWRFFKDGGHPPSWIWDVHLDHPWWALGGLYQYAKFGWNQCSSFDNMQVLIFCDLALKMPIHANEIFTGDLTPKWGAVSSRPPKGTSLCGNTSYDGSGYAMKCIAPLFLISTRNLHVSPLSGLNTSRSC